MPTGIPSSGDALIELIRAIVEPTSWDEVGGPGSISGASVSGVDMLVVSNTEEAHEEIALLLEKMREFVRCNRSPAAPAGKPAVDKPRTDDPPKTPPPAPNPAKKGPADRGDDPFGD